MRWMILLGAVTLAGCGDSAGVSAEKQYAMVKADSLSRNADLCDAARKAAEAYLAEHDQQNYETWRLTADNDCAAPAGAIHGH